MHMADNAEMMELTNVNEAEFRQLVEEAQMSGSIDQNLYVEYDVKRGLRDSSGNGVLTGLTEISDVSGTKNINGRKIPVDGTLFFQGFNVEDIIRGGAGRRFRYEEVVYLLLFGRLPSSGQLRDFVRMLSDLQELSGSFIRDIIMKGTNDNLMNSLMRAVLSLYSYDAKPDDISIPNVLRQSLQLVAKLPLISIYSYKAYVHFRRNGALVIKNPRKGFSTAENILHMLRDDGDFTRLEAEVLDICLVLHAEHGGGNNSTFTNHVVTSSGTDTYSAVAASIASLKGPRHGGANLKVQHMFRDIEANVSDWTSEEEVGEYLDRILDKQAFDHAGLIYGMGHAVYTLSDPRARILKEFAARLAGEKHMEKEFALYNLVEKIAPEHINARREIFKPFCANVDFYSGFVYQMLGIPEELFTPIFATARIAGWSAHRLEELDNAGKIIRPAYKYVGHHRSYVPIDDRDPLARQGIGYNPVAALQHAEDAGTPVAGSTDIIWQEKDGEMSGEPHNGEV
jgi:citrate synthase